VLVWQQERANPGQIVIALVDDEATIKKIDKGAGLLGPTEIHEPETPAPRAGLRFCVPCLKTRRRASALTSTVSLLHRAGNKPLNVKEITRRAGGLSMQNSRFDTLQQVVDIATDFNFNRGSR
jgi:hypothetical protein